MAFDPDKFIEQFSPAPPIAEFDPDKFIEQFSKPEPRPEEQSVFRQVADVPLKLGSGVVQGVRMIADAFGASSDTSKALRGAEDWISQYFSAQSKQDSKEMGRLIQEAKDDPTTLGTLRKAWQAFTTAPVDLVAQGLGTSAPAILTAVGTTLFGAPAAIGTAATLGIGTLMGAGTVKGAIYDAVKEELSKLPDMPKEEIERRAVLAQEYKGENLDSILGGAVFGAAAGRLGFEGSALRAATARVLGKKAEAEAAEAAAKEKVAEATARAAARGPIRQGARTSAVESGTEFAQGAQEQIAQNIALQREGFDVPTTYGALASGTLEALVGAPLGAAGGAREAAVARQEQARLKQEQADRTELERLQKMGQTTEEGLPPADLEFEDRVAALSQQYQDAMPREQADALARQMILDEDERIKAATAAPPVLPAGEVAPDPQRVEKITNDLVDIGIPLAEARVQALDLATEEAQGAANVRRPPVASSGEGVSVAAQPDATTTPGGAPVTQPTGVDASAAPAGPAVGGAAAQPTTVTPTTPTTPTAPALDVANLTNEQLEAIAEAAIFLGPDAETEAAKAELARRKAAAEPAAVTPTEGAPSAVETTQAVETKEEGAAAPATGTEVEGGEAPATGAKRGPKGPRLTEEEKAARAEGRKATNAENMRNQRALDAAEKQLDAALTPLDEGLFENETALAEAQDDKKVARRAAVETIYALRQKAGTTKQRQRADALLQKAGVTDAERTAIKDAIVRRKKALEAAGDLVKGEVTVSRSGKSTAKNVDKPDRAFSKFTDGTQAVNYIARAGNAFQKLVATAIRPFVKGVNFVVIEKGDPLPEPLQEAIEDWNESRGLFVRYTQNGQEVRAIYVRGASFGSDQGVNTTIVLHELLHAAGNLKIAIGLRDLMGDVTDSKAAKAVRQLVTLMDYVEGVYGVLEARGRIPASLRRTVESTITMGDDGAISYNIFSDPREFFAYGMSDSEMQNFLMSIDGLAPAKSGFSRFVDAVRRMFNIPEKESRALTELVDITEKLLAAEDQVSDTAIGRALDKAIERSSEISRAAKANKSRVNKTVNKIERSRDVTEAQNTLWAGISALVKDRDSTLLTDVLSARWSAFSSQAFRQLLPMIQTDVLAEWSKRIGLTKLADAYKLMVDMNAMRVSMTARAAPISDSLVELQGKSPQQYAALADVMHYSTLQATDPTKVTEGKVVELWDKLAPSTKKLYEKVRDYYASMYDLYHKSLLDRVTSSGIPGSASDPTSPRGKLIASIKLMYEQGKKNGPYFPLMRYGQYWLRIGKGKAGEFYMFESQSDREVALKTYVRSQGKPYEQLVADGDIEKGDDIGSARKDIATTSELLKNIFELVGDAAGKPVSVVDDYGNLTTKYSTIDPEQLKDEIYQLYLHTLPDKNFRRHFIHRQGKTGFSADISRNFATTSTNMINQMARLQYTPRMLDTISAQDSALANNPDKPKLKEFVTEMRLRAEREAYPDPDNTALAKLADSATKMSFLWMMSTVKTAVAQLSAIPVFAAPVLASRHGKVATAREMGRFLNVFNQMGTIREAPDGSTSFTMPSVLYSKEVQGDPEQLRAAQYMMDRGISETTLAYDLGNRRKRPTYEQQSAFRKTLGIATNAMTGLFHHSERLIREVTFMSAFRLNREKMPKASFEEVALAAENDTYAALANYSSVNRPRGVGALGDRSVVLDAHKPLGRTLLQFKMFPAFVTTYFVRNFYRMVWRNPNVTKEERKEAANQFFGTLTMSYAIAGVMGIPGFSFALGILSGLRNAMMGEDDDDPIAKRDLEFWFRNVWIPETFGNVQIGNRTLAEIMDRGLVASVTGYDISSSLSLNNMWFPEMKEQATAEATLKDYLFSLAGPSVSLATSQFPRAIDYFRQGKVLQGTEQLLPGLLRTPVTAYRYSQEGATTAAGAVIKDRDEFTVGQLIGQGMGFATEGLVAKREEIFKYNALVLQVKNERKLLLNRLNNELQSEDADVNKIMDDIMKFNIRNSFDAITGDTISESMRNRLKRRVMSDRGVQIEKKYYPQLFILLTPGTEKLEREASAARK